ncbi:MAG: hypothetical protein Ta2A_24350 [Treponemataceae bacterium]|nr:MAG: hypothetical protein Ta2A_24350 [Treponemataceae bacterium]
MRVLNRYGKTQSVSIDGKTVKVKAAKAKRPGNRAGRPIYGSEVIECLRKIWAFHWYKCGKDLAVYIRENIDYIEASRSPNFKVTPESRETSKTVTLFIVSLVYLLISLRKYR